MRLPALRFTLLPLLVALALTACHGKEDPSKPGGNTPEAAVQASVELLKAGDFNGLWKHALPPADYATMRTDWGVLQKNSQPVTPEDRARFNQATQALTGPDAENKLYAELQPKLTTMEQQYKDQLPVLVSVGAALLKNGVTQNKTLTGEQKTQANAVLDVLTPWAQQTPWFDQAKAKQAVGVAVATARKLDLKTPEQLRAMDFDTTMTKYSLGFAGARQLLGIYGLSVDDTLNSIKVTPIERTPLESSTGHARVKIDYTLLGKPLSTESKLVQQDGRWYSEDMLNNVRESHRQLSEQHNQPARSASAPAAVGAAPAKD